MDGPFCIDRFDTKVQCRRCLCTVSTMSTGINDVHLWRYLSIQDDVSHVQLLLLPRFGLHTTEGSRPLLGCQYAELLVLLWPQFVSLPHLSLSGVYPRVFIQSN